MTQTRKNPRSNMHSYANTAPLKKFLKHRLAPACSYTFSQALCPLAVFRNYPFNKHAGHGLLMLLKQLNATTSMPQRHTNLISDLYTFQTLKWNRISKIIVILLKGFPEDSELKLQDKDTT